MQDWRELTVSHWQLIDRLARHRFGERPLAEEAALAVMEALLADDGRRGRQYGGVAPYPVFLAAVARRLLEDFARQRFGRRVAPLWIRNLGGVWSILYDLLCLERLAIEEAVTLVGQSGTERSSADLEDAAWRIKQEVLDCGSHQGLEVGGDQETLLSATDPSTVAESIEEEERKQLFRFIFLLLTEADETLVERNLGRMIAVRISLLPEEKLLLKLCFQDNVTVAQAGRMLGLNRHQVHGRLRRLLARIRATFAEAGLERELLELLR